MHTLRAFYLMMIADKIARQATNTKVSFGNAKSLHFEFTPFEFSQAHLNVCSKVCKYNTTALYVHETSVCSYLLWVSLMVLDWLRLERTDSFQHL